MPRRELILANFTEFLVTVIHLCETLEKALFSLISYIKIDSSPHCECSAATLLEGEWETTLPVNLVSPSKESEEKRDEPRTEGMNFNNIKE
ncbi:UNVERIFIED_CONTAM: hypothetical protein NCL1_16354 [Trichonephila clavipes]